MSITVINTYDKFPVIPSEANRVEIITDSIEIDNVGDDILIKFGHSEKEIRVLIMKRFFRKHPKFGMQSLNYESIEGFGIILNSV